jgi:hypothetical protein
VSGIIFLVVGLLGGVALHGLIFGRGAMVAEWPTVVSALAAYGALCILFLLFNLVAAPYRIERDMRLSLEEESAVKSLTIERLDGELREAREEAPDIRLNILQLIYGGETDHFPDKIMVGASVRVSNRGREPSALDGWSLLLITKDGEGVPLELTHLGGRTTLSLLNGQMLSFDEGELIYLKGRQPIGSGAMVAGFLIGFLPASLRSLFDGATLELSCVDVRDRRIIDSKPLRNEGPSEEMMYIPHLDVRFGQEPEGETNG